MKIVIYGTCAEGKTTVALLIQAALMQAGFGANNADFDVVNATASDHVIQERRVEELVRRGLLIDIETVQLRKEVSPTG